MNTHKQWRQLGECRDHKESVLTKPEVRDKVWLQRGDETSDCERLKNTVKDVGVYHADAEE